MYRTGRKICKQVLQRCDEAVCQRDGTLHTLCSSLLRNAPHRGVIVQKRRDQQPSTALGRLLACAVPILQTSMGSIMAMEKVLKSGRSSSKVLMLDICMLQKWLTCSKSTSASSAA